MKPWTTAAKLCAVALSAAGVSSAAPPGVPPSWPPRAGSTTHNVCLPFTPSAGWCGDGGPALAARLAAPGSIAVLPDDGFAVADTFNSAVREVAPTGTIRTVASFGPPWGCWTGQIVRAPDGRLIVAAPGCARVYAIAPSGAISVVAGDGRSSFFGRGPLDGPATRVRMFAPTGVAILADGTLLIADEGRTILRVDVHGDASVLRTRPHIPATTLLAMPDGSVLASDPFEGTIWRLDPASGATRVAVGSPTRRATRWGDYVTRYDPAVGMPAGMAAAADGGFVFADYLHDRVRRVDTAGRITTVAGDGIAGFAGDGGPALDARLSKPTAVAIRDDGGLLVADAGNDRIRLVSPDGTIDTLAGSGRPLGPRRSDAPPGFETPCYGGCGDIAYNRVWNYFYITGRPLVVGSGKPFSIRLVTSRAGRVRLDVRRRGRHIRRVRARVVPGQAAIRMRPLPAGRYSIEATASASGLAAYDEAGLRVR